MAERQGPQDGIPHGQPEKEEPGTWVEKAENQEGIFEPDLSERSTILQTVMKVRSKMQS